MPPTKHRLNRVSRILRMAAKLEKLAGNMVTGEPGKRVFDPGKAFIGKPYLDYQLKNAVPALLALRENFEGIVETTSRKAYFKYAVDRGGKSLVDSVKAESVAGIKAVNYTISRIEKVVSGGAALRALGAMPMLIKIG